MKSGLRASPSSGRASALGSVTSRCSGFVVAWDGDVADERAGGLDLGHATGAFGPWPERPPRAFTVPGTVKKALAAKPWHDARFGL